LKGSNLINDLTPENRDNKLFCEFVGFDL